MEPSKIEITNLRDDEGNIEVSAVNVSRYDLMFGLVTSGMVVAKQMELSREEFLDVLQGLTWNYEFDLTKGCKEVFSDD